MKVQIPAREDTVRYKPHPTALTKFSPTLDHIQPVSRGGDNSFGNLITACLHCNAERGNKPVMDYVTQKGGNEP
ncbi:HNH endonuclease [Methylotuvimicrobium buryatense]|uniref:HNH endonuclease n=1 Tax=Methylotuvimicrobium buryatense TaxID=95641 RepID=A0A4P9UTI0_METBY|nr:HNH endonuclease [Methylotuvimicrobium buryatense]